MPGHGVAHRSGNVFLATAWRIPSRSFLDEPLRERWGARISKGCHRPSRLVLPQAIYSQTASQRGSRRCPSLWSPNNPDLLGPSRWLLGVLPHLPMAEQEGSWCAAAARKHLGRARSLQPLHTLCLLHILFQAHFFSSPTWESSCCPEPTATILYKVIFPLSAENNTKVIPSLPEVSKETKHFSRSVPI